MNSKTFLSQILGSDCGNLDDKVGISLEKYTPCTFPLEDFISKNRNEEKEKIDKYQREENKKIQARGGGGGMDSDEGNVQCSQS